MTWTDIPPPLRTAHRRGRIGSVRVSLATYGRKHDIWNLSVTFCLQAVREVSWLREGVAVQVQRGQGEHDGQLRLVPSPKGLYMLRRRASTSDKADFPAVALLIPPFPGLDLVRRESTSAEWDWSDNWIEVTLPPWAATRQLRALSAPPAEGASAFAPVARPPSTILIDKAFGGRPTAPGWRDGDTPTAVSASGAPSPSALSWPDR